MLPFLSLTLAGGALFVGWRQHWRPQPRLIDVLAPAVVSPTSPRQPLMRLYAGSPQQNLAFSVGLLGLTTVSYLGMPVLRLVTLPGLCYFDGYFIRAAYMEWQANRRVGVATSDAVLAAGLLVTRQWGANSLFTTLFFTSHTLQAKSVHQLALVDEQALAVYPSVNAPSDPAAEGRWSSAKEEEPKAQWQKLIDQSALPLLTLSAVSMPWLGAKRALAVLLTNFGYDYRLMMPLSTLRYLATAKAQGIWLRDGLVLETLQQVDVLVVDEATWHANEQPIDPPDSAPTLITITKASPDPVAQVAALQAAGHVVAYLAQAPTQQPAGHRADLRIGWGNDEASAAEIRLAELAQLQQLWALRKALTTTRQRGLYLALAPSLINLSGIYFFRFGVITTLLVDYGGTAAGMFNALGSQPLSIKMLTVNAQG